MQTVIQQGGIQPGGLNFDAKVRRESTDVVDLFIAHIGNPSFKLSFKVHTQFISLTDVNCFFYGTCYGESHVLCCGEFKMHLCVSFILNYFNC